MLTELKRCNNVGSIEGILFLAKILFDKPYVNKQEIANRVALENSITLNCSGATAFFVYLGYLEDAPDKVMPTEKLNSMQELSGDDFIQKVVQDCVITLTEEGLFDTEKTHFDIEKGHLSIKRSAFPLAYAAIRNFLTVTGALDREEHGEIGISESFETEFANLLRERKKKFSLEQLIQQQKEQSERGLEAEEYVLQVEKNRLPKKAKQIKRISDFDVTAGYDLVSFQSETSSNYDRFIEVKCYLGDPHFYWSENEVDVAKIKGEHYFLCLVDYERMKTEPGYIPEYIQDPTSVIFEDSSWIVSTASYKVKKI